MKVGVISMYESRIKKVFDYLTADYKYHSASEIANELNCSEKTIRNEIKELRDIFLANGAKIQSQKGKGYRFLIDNKK